MPRGPVDVDARERILDATDRLLVRFGFRKMTVDDVAAEADVGKGSVYLHFRSKQDIALSCIDRMADAVLSRLRALAREERPAPARLCSMLRLRVLHRFDYARPHAHSIDEKLAAMRQTMLVRRHTHFAREAAVIAGVLRAGQREGTLRAAPVAATSEALVTATNSLLPYSLSVRELGRRAAIERRTDALIDLLLAGLERPPAPHRKPRRNA